MAPLDEETLVTFAERELTQALGDEIPRCFLAGGAYKTLLHGRPPRDLDLWAETPEARERLIFLLRSRGQEHPSAPGAERFQLPDRLVEVSFQVETMEERLARFDLGLASIAVAFRGAARPSLLHPLALESIRQRSILLVQLAHPGLALATMVRVRRYASDLTYTIPAGVESLLWNAFLSFSPEDRRALVQKLRHHYGEATWGVEHEAQQRCG